MLGKFNKQSGSILISLIVTLPFLILIAANFTQLSVNNFGISRDDQFTTLAQFAADGGIEKSMEEINLSNSWTGTAGPVVLQNDSTAFTTYEATVTSISTNRKEIQVTGRAFTPGPTRTLKKSITIDVEIRAIISPGFSIISGVGGLTMSNSSNVVGGEVHVNGKIELKNTSSIGVALDPVDVTLAHQNCPIPADANYPRLCGPGEDPDQPITILNSAHIYGDVKANNQTSTDGMSDPGLTASSGVAVQPLPAHDRVAQKNAMASTMTGSDASCSSVGGTKTWPADVHITGDVTISLSCTVTILGDVWIDGKLEIKNSGVLAVGDSLGSDQPDIMVDGQDGMSIENSSAINSNINDTGARFITYWSTASCSPDCIDVNGTDLFNSADDITILIKNSASAAESTFYSRWTKVSLQNTGHVGALAGMTVDLNNSAVITFGSSGGGGVDFWVIDSYRRAF